MANKVDDEMHDLMWEKGVFGDDTPQKLQNILFTSSPLVLVSAARMGPSNGFGVMFP